MSTAEIIERALSDGKRVAVPCCVSGTNKMLFYRISGLDELKKGCFNIQEPVPDEKNLIASFFGFVCLVPGLSYDFTGNRLGYGKGFYDRFLRENTVDAVGLCYDDFLSDALPQSSTDYKVKTVYTEKRIIENLTVEEAIVNG